VPKSSKRPNASRYNKLAQASRDYARATLAMLQAEKAMNLVLARVFDRHKPDDRRNRAIAIRRAQVATRKAHRKYMALRQAVDVGPRPPGYEHVPGVPAIPLERHASDSDR